MLTNVRQDQIGGNRRHLVQPRFAELPLDVVLGGKAEAPKGLETSVGRLPTAVGRQQLGHVRFWPRGCARVEQASSLEAHQVCRADVGVGARNRKLNTLVLSNRSVKD